MNAKIVRNMNSNQVPVSPNPQRVTEDLSGYVRLVEINAFGFVFFFLQIVTPKKTDDKCLVSTYTT